MAPILASSLDGSKSLAIQVKTSVCANRWIGRGTEKKVGRKEWNLGRKAAKTSFENLVFVFVDLEDDCDGETTSYIIPSSFIFEYCKAWVDEVPWVRFHIPINEIEPFKDNWDIISKALKLVTTQQ